MDELGLRKTFLVIFMSIHNLVDINFLTSSESKFVTLSTIYTCVESMCKTTISLYIGSQVTHP